jgi:hypothetical protein
MEKKFKLLQLFSILDGRLSTKMEDVYDMLNHITGESLMTHHLPTAMKFLKEKNPVWFQEGKKTLAKMGITKETEFQYVMSKLKTDKTVIEVPKMSDEELKDFGQFMIDNSLLNTIGSKNSYNIEKEQNDIRTKNIIKFCKEISKPL